MNVTVIIPVYNEVKTLKAILEKIHEVGVASEILIVDDGSTDGTRALYNALDGNNNVRVILHKNNMGKGAAVRTGIENAKGDILIIQDADLEYNPQDYPAILEPILTDQADVVYGSRFLGSDTQDFLFLSKIANRFLTFVTNLLYRNSLSDMETCYKAFRRDIVKDITFKSRRFEFEPEFTAKILKRNIHILEVPISYNPRGYSEGKKISVWDGLESLWTLIKYRFVE